MTATSPSADGAPGRPARKRWSRLVFLPAAVGALGLGGTAAAWLVMRGEVLRALDGAAAHARGAGVGLSLGEAHVGGFPFRLRVAVGPVRLAGRSGWALEAPSLVAQAYVYAPLHWVLVAPDGLTVTRPQDGPVRVSGALRASVAGVGRSPWRITVAGDDVAFATPPGAKPFPLVGAQRIGLYLKPAEGGAAGDGAVLLDLACVRATPGSLAWNLAPDAPVDAAVEGRLTALAAWRGRDWGERARRWAAAGGALRLGHAEALGGPTELWAQGGAVALGDDGRLVGDVPLRLRQAPELFAGPAGAQTMTVQRLDPAAREAAGSRFDLRLEGGEVRLGPVRVGPSPRVR